jgi:hypothetical protein
MNGGENRCGILVQKLPWISKIEECEVPVGNRISFTWALTPVLVSVGGHFELIGDSCLEKSRDGDGGENDENAC